MIGTRSALLATTLLLTAPAMAAQPEGGHYVYVPPGATVVMLPAASPALPVDFPVIRMMAQQQAMMQHMMADMDSMMAMPMLDPGQMIRSVMDGMPRTMPGSGVVLTQVSTGSGSCSETIVYRAPGANGQPQIHVTRTGNACGAITTTGPIGVTQTVPAPAAPATTAPPQDRLWHVSYPARPVTVYTAPGT